MGPNLTIEIDKTNKDYGLIIFKGDFDKAGHNEVHDVLSVYVREFDGKILVFDFTNLKFINSEGIGYVMEVQTLLKQKDAELVILGLNNHVKDVFQTIGIMDVVTIHKDLKEFLSKLE